MATTFDKLWWIAFTVVSAFGLIAGACIPIIYLIPPQALPAAGHNFSLGEVLLCLAGMAVGYVATLTVFGVISHRFVSSATHQRWAESLGNNTYVQYRAPGLAKLIRWALIPAQDRGADKGGHAL
jgi:hypothetical protein